MRCEVFDPKDWTKSIDALTDVLRGQRGTTGLPLAWCVRNDEEVVADPAEGWATVDDELINRAQIKTGAGQYTTEFKDDNQKVWEIINGLTRNLPCYAHIEKSRTKKDGRAAFLALKQQYLGEDHFNNQATAAENALRLARYEGETKRHDFESYVRIHVRQHNILTKLSDTGYHEGVTEATKVRKFLEGIKAPALKEAVAVALVSSEIKNNFTKCASYFPGCSCKVHPKIVSANGCGSHGRKSGRRKQYD